MHHRLQLAAATLLITLSVAACGGGSTAGTPGALPTPDIDVDTFFAVSTTAGETATVTSGSYVEAVTFPAATSGSGTIAITGSATQPTGTPALSTGRPGQASTLAFTGTTTPLAFLTLTASSTDAFGAYPSITITLPPGTATANQSFDLAYLPPGATRWTEPEAGPATVAAVNGANTLTFAPASFVTATLPLPLQFSAGAAYRFALVAVAGSPATPMPTPTATPVQTATPTVLTTPAACATGSTAVAVCSISPTSGSVGSTLTINGNNFASPTVMFSGGVIAGGSFTATQIIVTVPTGAQTGPITVTSSGQSAMSQAFTVIP